VAEGAADGLGQTPLGASFTNDALAVPFAVGVGVEVRNGPDVERLKAAPGRLLENDPNSAPHRRARERFYREQRAADPEGRVRSDLGDLARLQRYQREEIEAAANRMVDPIKDFEYGLKTAGLVKGRAAHRPAAPVPGAAGYARCRRARRSRRRSPRSSCSG
jgi:hypothetical protein